MKDRKELTLQDLMQMSHDMKDLEKELDMIKEFMSDDEIKTILKITKDE